MISLYKILGNKSELIVTENRSVVALGGCVGTGRDRSGGNYKKA